MAAKRGSGQGGGEISRGPGGGRKHESHGRGSEESGAYQNRAREKQEKLNKAISDEQSALEKATAEVEALRKQLGDNNFKLVLGKKTLDQYIREKQLGILGRKQSHEQGRL